ncbi:MAG: hypothetical protein QNJ89_14725 [Acidimicrobiia bacterium]|nr:hypothetical protein [Acidimicrobiia bacterium]
MRLKVPLLIGLRDTKAWQHCLLLPEVRRVGGVHVRSLRSVDTAQPAGPPCALANSECDAGANGGVLGARPDYTDDGGGDLFTDDDGSIFDSDVDKLAAVGVTRSRNPPLNDRFCRTSNVTRVT